MRILLDECVPARLKAAFPGHAVHTVTEIGWRTSNDRPLLEFAQGRFDVFVTIDRKLEKQYDLAAFHLGFVIARVPNSRLEAFRPILAELKAAAERVGPGHVIQVQHPDTRR